MIEYKKFTTPQEAAKWLSDKSNIDEIKKKYGKDYQCDYNTETMTIEIWHKDELIFDNDPEPVKQRKILEHRKKNN